MRYFSIFLMVLFGVFTTLLAQPNVNTPDKAPVDDGQITLEDIWLKFKYFPESPSQFRWMKDDRFYSTVAKSKGIIFKNSIEDEKRVGTILDLNKLDFGEGIEVDDISGYSFNADESQILLRAKSESIFRRSSKAYCFVYNQSSKSLKKVYDGKKISNPTFSPDSKKIAFTFDNNLYYQDLETSEVTPVTTDGRNNHIINGSTDWVYEEELSFVRAFEWSPDSKYLGFFRFDESSVPQFVMPLYGQLYPDPYTFKYPKAGEANSVVTIHAYNLDKKKTKQVDIGNEPDQYIARMTWTPKDGQLALLRLNRLQNHLDLVVADPKTGKSEILLTEKNDSYIDVENDKWEFLSASGDLIWTSDQSGHNHIYRYDSKGKLKSQLTKGEFDVTEILGIDEEEGTLYFMSTEVSPLERHMYSVKLNGKKKKRLTTEGGTHSVTFSSDLNFYVDSYSSVHHPRITVLAKADGTPMKTLVENKRLASDVSNLDIKAPEFFSFNTSEEVSLNGWMIKPSDFDKKKKYPVLMFVYGGPGSQTVSNAWGSGRPFNYMWYQMLAQKGYIVVSVDNRGTGGRGAEFMKSTYADLGKYETIDQIEAAKYLQTQSYVDSDRIGIWGWSYGGYMTSLCMVKGDGIFKAGIAVAPVTNWRFYDTIYTERYLKTPQENPDGYDKNSPINFAKDLQGSYLLIHGTADDNVHYQNSMEWVSALVAANKQFDVFFYPNKNHGIFGGNTRYHLYKKMTDFLEKNL